MTYPYNSVAKINSKDNYNIINSYENINGRAITIV